jgi:hypothetical protein
MQNSLSRLMSAKAVTFSAALLAVAAPTVAAGCSSAPASTGPTMVGATAVVYDRSTHAIAVTGPLTTVDGTYGADCAGHASGTDTWTLTIPSSSTDNLAVVTSDPNCTLSVTQLATATNTYAPNTPIVMTGGTFAPTASQYSDVGAPGTIVFYANAELLPGDFSGNFTVDVFTSDDPANLAPTTITATTLVVGTATQSGVAPPNYTEGNTLGIIINGADVVQSSSGIATYTLPVATPQPGEAWVIAPDGFTPSFATDDAAFTVGSGTFIAPTTIAASPFTIPASAFNLDTTTVPETRTVIIQHVDGPSGDRTYETIRYTFTP